MSLLVIWKIILVLLFRNNSAGRVKNHVKIQVLQHLEINVLTLSEVYNIS